jgi:hypothetical protein
VALKRKKPFIVLLAFFIILTPFFIVFFQRPPALVVTDASFVALYGTGRLKQQTLVASLTMKRRVRPVLIADGAGTDVLLLGIEGTSSRPHCVLFPSRYIEAAEQYREQFPHIPVIIMEGRNTRTSGTGTSNFLVCRTDRETDSYRAGLCAGIIAGEEPQRIIVFQDRSANARERNAFIRGLREQGLETPPVFYNNASQLTDTKDLSCVVLLGSGAEILEKNLKVPVILCTWLDPDLTSNEIVLIFDDSPWTMAVPALGLVKIEQNEDFNGRIPSKPLVFSARIADNHISQNLKKAVEKPYEKTEERQ